MWKVFATACIQVYVVDTHLPEGVRLLSVFVSTDEYKDLVRRRSSQLIGSGKVEPSQPVLVSCSDIDSVDSNSHTINVDISDCGIIGEDNCKHTDDKDSSINTNELTQQQDKLHETDSDQLSAVSDDVFSEVHRPCNEPTSDIVVPVRDHETNTTVAQSTLTNNSDISSFVDDESKQLMPLELYIQGNSQTLFVLFMHQGSLSQLDVVTDLVSTVC